MFDLEDADSTCQIRKHCPPTISNVNVVDAMTARCIQSKGDSGRQVRDRSMRDLLRPSHEIIIRRDVASGNQKSS